MSLKYAVVQDGLNRYVLPKVGDMRCDVVGFLSPRLYAATEEEMWRDAMVSASYPGAIGMYLMPDCHKGYVLPVGGVLVTQDTIAQAGSGYDIGCGVVYLQVPGLHAQDVADWDLRSKWVQAVQDRIALGYDRNRPRFAKTVTSATISEVLRYGAKAVGGNEGLCERSYIPIVESDFDERFIDKAYNKASSQLGSVGGGNHFVELQVDKDTGSVWIMIHCGSRGFGWQAANYFFDRGAELRGLPKGRKEESWLRLDEPLGALYWAWHNAAANYAIANRHTITHGVAEATQEVFGADSKLYYEISHNLVQQETLVLPDGTTQKGFVHRKGATRAFPAGHPDLVGTRWESTGHPCLIPGSMLAGAAILQPLQGAYASGCSVNHGSGRLMGRNVAKRDLADLHGDIDDEMRTIVRDLGGTPITGIVSNCLRIPLDECGHVYKDLDEVIGVLQENRIAKLQHRLYPVANLKGSD